MGRLPALIALLAIAAGAALAADEPGARVTLDLGATEASVGDPIALRLSIEVAAEGAEPERRALGPRLGPFAVVDEAWSEPEPGRTPRRWVWEGRLAAFRTGRLALPAVTLRVLRPGAEPLTLATEPRSIEILSVLDPAEADPALAEIKPPVSLPADYGVLAAAAAVVAGLLAAALLLWWLVRRYGARLAAVPPPDDPFRRIAPDAWIYAELQKLLERRLAEQGQVDRFFAELSRIVKLYLAGRFRVALLERTTEEIPAWLRQSGVAAESLAAIEDLLASCDRVKFARHWPGAEDCREAVERAYRIVDATKPRPAATASGAA